MTERLFTWDPVKDRKNLRVLTKALTTRIILKDGRAVGVEYLKDGKTATIQAAREVLLCGGAFNSPHLLQVSGIGDRSLLQAHGIDIVYEDSAVGENLQDHIRPGMSFEAVDGLQDHELISPEDQRNLYGDHRTGPWAERA